jgi:hypothetical protein
MASPGSNIDGKQFADQRSYSMTETIPPKDYTWNTHNAADYKNNPPLNQSDPGYRQARLAYLAQFDLEISDTPEKGYRYWRWLDGETSDRTGHKDQEGKYRSVIWWERRKFSDPFPKRPGIWPQDI